MPDQESTPSSEVPTTVSTADLERAKLRAEIERIQTETRGLRRPSFFNATTITAISAAALGWLNFWYQLQEKNDANHTLLAELARSNKNSAQPPPPASADGTPVAPTVALSPETTNSPSGPAPPTARVSPSPEKPKARLHVYFANVNQIGRMLDDVYSVFPKNGFSVVEANRMDERNRPTKTQVRYFADADQPRAKQLQGIIKAKLDVASSEIVRGQAVGTDNGKRGQGDFEVWFERSVRSPAASWLNFFSDK